MQGMAFGCISSFEFSVATLCCSNIPELFYLYHVIHILCLQLVHLQIEIFKINVKASVG